MEICVFCETEVIESYTGGPYVHLNGMVNCEDKKNAAAVAG